jgi:hypothetical protein
MMVAAASVLIARRTLGVVGVDVLPGLKSSAVSSPKCKRALWL